MIHYQNGLKITKNLKTIGVSNMEYPESLNVIVEIFKKGEESDMYISTVEFLFKTICEEKEAGTYDMKKHFESAIQIHIRLRGHYQADFNGPLLSWYRRFIGLHGGLE